MRHIEYVEKVIYKTCSPHWETSYDLNGSMYNLPEIHANIHP